MRAIALLCAVLTALAASPSLAAGPRVIDGDTLEWGGRTIRLMDIDAPELSQTCTHGGRAWDCGTASARALRALVSRGRLTCRGNGTDRYGRRLAHCAVAGQDIGATLVASGMALAYTRFSDRYVSQQRAAKAARLGLWSGPHQTPWDYRAGQAKPRQAQAAPKGCPIKGNINSKGERIYHSPSSRHYADARINRAKGERWFCSEREAVAAGWRAPRR